MTTQAKTEIPQGRLLDKAASISSRTLLLIIIIAAIALRMGSAVFQGNKINDLPGYQPAVDLSSSDKAGSETEAGAKPSLPRNEAGQITIQTIDLLYAAEEPAMRADFENNEVELIGQYMPARAHNSEGDRFNLVRMFVVCCAADARPVAVTVQTAKKDSIAEMSWVKVTGKATFPVEGGQRIPMVVAKEVALCDPPEETFIY